MTLLLGGQWGGEGKGAITAFLAATEHPAALVKTGGPNSSHTYGVGGEMWKVRMLPSGCNLTQCAVIFPAGCLLETGTLFAEIDALNFDGTLLIDRQAGLVDERHVAAQRDDPFYDNVGSTRTGTGAASADRCRRRLHLAESDSRLHPYLSDTAEDLSALLTSRQRILVEGSQGFGLSNYHGPYPFVTSRDTTAGAVLSQLGLGPRSIGTIVLVLKCFPTRNSHGFAPLVDELTDSQLDNLGAVALETGGGSYQGGDRRRRVGLFDWTVAARAIRANTPDVIALTGLDRLAAAMELEPTLQQHYGDPIDFPTTVARRLGVPVGLLSYGPNIESVVDTRDVGT
jgi:adenylosuccinate synthase